MPGSLWAQRAKDFEFGHIGQKEGLSFRPILCMLHDRQGYLWVGTDIGLNRYDGAHFVQFRHQPGSSGSLPHNLIQSLCEDQQGRIWIAGGLGVYYFDKVTGLFHTVFTPSRSYPGVCVNIRCDQSGDIWFTNRSALFRYTLKTGKLAAFPCNPPNPMNVAVIMVNGLIPDPGRAGIWVSTTQGLRYFDIHQLRFTEPGGVDGKRAIFTKNKVWGLCLDGNNLLIGDCVDHAIVVFDVRRRRVVRTIAPTDSGQRKTFSPMAIFADRQHNIWASSSEYINFYINTQSGQITEFSNPIARSTSIRADAFRAGWQHPDGTVWLGTFNGIAYTNPERALYSVYDVGALYPQIGDDWGIMSFAEDPDGSWWLGASLRGLVHYYPATNTVSVYRLPNRTRNLPWGGEIPDLTVVDNEVWLNGASAIYRFDKQTHQFTELRVPRPVDSLRVSSHESLTYEDGELWRGRYWVVGGSKQVNAYNLGKKAWESYPILSGSKDPQFFARQVIPTRRGELYLDISPGGFARFDARRNAFVVTDSTHHDYESTIKRVVESPTGTFLISAPLYGLIEYDPVRKRSWVRSENDGMKFNRCYAALPDRLGNIWTATLNNFSIIKAGEKRVLNFSLPLNEHLSEVWTLLAPLRNGNILFPQKGYIVEFRPDQLRPSVPESRVLLNRLVLPDTAILLHENQQLAVQLASDDNSFTLEFSVLQDEANHTYQYKLDGYDDAWQETNGQNQATYTKVPGGTYTFQVKAIGPDGRKTVASIQSIHVDTPFYRATWFWVIIGIVLLSLLLGFLKYRADQIAQVHELQVQASRLERDKSEIQYQNLINHLNPHFLFNSLTSLNSLITIDPRQASTFLRKLSAIYRYILQNKDKDMVPLQDELAFVQQYIDLQTSRFGDGLQISVEVPGQYLTRFIVPVTLQNLLENAIKHNIIDDDSPLTIRIYTEGDFLCVINKLQKKAFVETSNKQGLVSLKSMYRYLSRQEMQVIETATEFLVKVPLL